MAVVNKSCPQAIPSDSVCLLHLWIQIPQVSYITHTCKNVRYDSQEILIGFMIVNTIWNYGFPHHNCKYFVYYKSLFQL